MRARCFLWLAAQWLPCSIPILLNFSWLNFSWLNFSWLNFSLPNFSLLNFSWLIFSLLNFSWLNFSWWILCTWILQDLQRRRTISSQICSRCLLRWICASFAVLELGIPRIRLGEPGPTRQKHTFFLPAKQATYWQSHTGRIMNIHEPLLYLRATTQPIIGKVIPIKLWIFMNHLRSTGFAARIM